MVENEPEADNYYKGFYITKSGLHEYSAMMREAYSNNNYIFLQKGGILYYMSAENVTYGNRDKYESIESIKKDIDIAYEENIEMFI